MERRCWRCPGRSLRRDPVEDFADEYGAPAEPERVRRAALRRPAVKLKLAGRLPLPTSMAGIIATGVALLLLLGGVLWLLAVTRMFLRRDARFRLAGASSIEIEGNHHLTRTQLLRLFAEDIDRNIFGVSLDQRRADLEAISWVRHATVMRLLPGRLRVLLEERTPVAFVRQGGHIGLVDANGVLLEMPTGPQTEHYLFPVVTGIAANDPLSTRAARMKIFERFTGELDVGGATNTESLSEIDLSNPEDVRALVEAHGATVLVHFGEDHFLERFRKVMDLLPQWHAQYPNLASADMRYEHEIPLGMAKPVVSASAVRPLLNPGSAIAAAHPAVHPLSDRKPATHPAAKKVPLPAHSSSAEHAGEQGFVPAPPVKPWQPTLASTPSVSAAARSAFVAKQPPSSAPVAKAPVPISAQAPASPKIQPALPVKPSAAAPHSAAGVAPPKHTRAKPSAGKPSALSSPNPTPQAAQQ